MTAQRYFVVVVASFTKKVEVIAGSDFLFYVVVFHFYTKFNF